MSETLDTTNAQAGKRPVFLTVLCILSFVAAGFGIIGMLIVALGRGAADATGATLNTSTPGVDTSAVEAIFSWPYIITSIVLIVIGLIGVIQMWKLKKTGFYVYTGTQVAGIIVPLIFGIPFGVFGTVMAIAFIVMYGLNLKAMK